MTENWFDIRSGCIANLPLAASVAAYGSVLGVLAAQKGIGLATLLFMNLTVFAGSAQFVIVEMWTPPLPIAEIVLAVAAINLRYLLMSAALQPLFAGKSLAHKMGFMHLVADENWAVTISTHRLGGASTYFLLGGGLCIVTAWCGGTMTGHLLGSVVRDPRAYAFDFAFVAVFTAIVVGLWRGKQDLFPWLVAAVVSVASEHWFPGKWYIVMGGIAGALAGAFDGSVLQRAGWKS